LRCLLGMSLWKAGNRFVCLLRERHHFPGLDIEHECFRGGGAAIDAEAKHN
jgi:hypothetical protein